MNESERERLMVQCSCLEHEVEKYRFRYIHNMMAKMELYRGDPRLLMEVLQKDGSTQAELASCLCVKPPSLTVMLKRMESAGMVCRRQDANDLRITRVYITKKGRENAEKTKETFIKMNETMRNGLSPEQLREYTAILKTMKQNLLQATKETDGKGCDGIV